ncbi:MAG: Holliday junction branch migration protein RuvA [Oligoflexus sp.]
MLIERLRGKYLANLGASIVIDVDGVGYGVELPLSLLCSLPPLGSDMTLWTYTYVREDALRLFGFFHYEDRVAFSIMLGISGVGPKVALAILSTLSVSAIRHAVASSQPQILEAVPGVGKRMAEKILLELKPKLARLQSPKGLELNDQSIRLEASDFQDFVEAGNQEEIDQIEMIFADVKSALENLGFKDKVIGPLLKTLRRDYQQGEFPDVMRAALRLLNKQAEGKPKGTSSRSTPSSTRLDQELF